MDMGDCKKGLSKPYVLRTTEDLLRGLQTNYIDLYQFHLEDPKYLGIDLPCFYIVEKLSPVESER